MSVQNLMFGILVVHFEKNPVNCY